MGLLQIEWVKGVPHKKSGPGQGGARRILGGGAALLLGGVGIRFVAKSDFDRYDNDVTILCPPQGCAKDELPQSTTDVLDRAELEDTIASALLITGAATAVTAGVLLYLNREQSVEEMLPTISPMVAPGTAGVSFEFKLD